MTHRSKARRMLPPVMWSVLVAALLLVPGDEIPDPEGWEWLDKPVHALLFAVHYGLLASALASSRPAGRLLAAAALISGAYAVVLETAQLWIPGRAWEWWDLGGALVGIAGAALLVASRRARLRAAS